MTSMYLSSLHSSARKAAVPLCLCSDADTEMIASTSSDVCYLSIGPSGLSPFQCRELK